MMISHNNVRSFLLMGLLVGSAAGSSAVLLLAPSTGKRSRDIVRVKGGMMAGLVRDRLKPGSVTEETLVVIESPE